jgi:putative membrane protein
MKNFSIGLTCLLLCSVPALTQKSAATNPDQQFVDFAAQTDMTEAHLGQLAADQAASADVKQYAQMLASDHTNDYQQLTAAATKAGLNVPKGLDAAHNKMIAPFEKLKGAAFDQRFVREMVAGHTKAITEYKREASDGQNADLKAYANQAQPVLEKHLQSAKELEKPKGGKRKK